MEVSVRHARTAFLRQRARDIKAKNPDMSYRAIAARIGANHDFVRKACKGVGK